MQFKAFRKRDHRHFYVLEAIGPVALLTIEMRMHVRYRTFILTFTHLIFYRTCTVVDRVDDMMLLEDFKGPEYAGLVWK